MKMKRDPFGIPKLGFSYLWRTGQFFNGPSRRRVEGILQRQRGLKISFGVSGRSLEVNGQKEED